MGLFKKNNPTNNYAANTDSAALAQRALDYIAEGVLVVDETGMVQFANPAIAIMAGHENPEAITGLDYRLVTRLADSEGNPVEPQTTEVFTALSTNQKLETREYMLISVQTEKRMPVAISVIPTGSVHDFKILTFRDIATELAEENEQAEFISTASHEMRTPVASIEGYLGLALNPQTATIDERAKQYLESAHTASQHLGRLFRDLLDVTKLDDKHIKARLVPMDAVEVVQRLVAEHFDEMAKKKLKYSFGTNETSIDKKRIEPKVYMAADIDFLKEIIDNLVGNAIKYTPEGGEIWVNCRGDGDKVLINVTDTGIGISADDAAHIFQKFYRVDNSKTREIGGTGLGLYLVKQRVEALGGRVWVESAFGDGSTFFVSLPRLSDSDFEKMSIAVQNQQMINNFQQPTTLTQGAGGVPGVAQPVNVPTPAAPQGAAPVMTPAQPVATGAVAAQPPAQPAAAQPVAQTTARSAVATPAAQAPIMAPATSPTPQVAAPTQQASAGAAAPQAPAVQPNVIQEAK